MKTAAAFAGRRLKGRKPAQASASASAIDEHGVVRVTRDGVDREEDRTRSPASVAASPSMLSSRLKAFVMPTSQTTRDGVREDLVRDRSATFRPLESTSAGGRRAGRRASGSAPSEKSRRARPAAKRIAQPPRIRQNSPARAGTAPTASARPTPAAMPATIPRPPNIGVGRSCQRSSRGARRSARQRAAKQQPDGRGRGGKCSDRRERLHGAEA